MKQIRFALVVVVYSRTSMSLWSDIMFTFFWWSRKTEFLFHCWRLLYRKRAPSLPSQERSFSIPLFLCSIPFGLSYVAVHPFLCKRLAASWKCSRESSVAVQKECIEQLLSFLTKSLIPHHFKQKSNAHTSRKTNNTQQDASGTTVRIAMTSLPLAPTAAEVVDRQ